MFGINKKATKSDEELIVLYKDTHDMKYLGELFTRHSRLIGAIAYKYLNNATETEDAVMEIFEILVEDLKNTEVQNFKGWLYSVTKNHALKIIRKRRKDTDFGGDIEKSPESFMESDMDSSLTDKEALENELTELEKAVKGLKEDQRICIELFYLQDKSYQEVAEITGYDLNKVKSHIQNGKRKLKIHLEKDD